MWLLDCLVYILFALIICTSWIGKLQKAMNLQHCFYLVKYCTYIPRLRIDKALSRTVTWWQKERNPSIFVMRVRIRLIRLFKNLLQCVVRSSVNFLFKFGPIILTIPFKSSHTHSSTVNIAITWGGYFRKYLFKQISIQKQLTANDVSAWLLRKLCILRQTSRKKYWRFYEVHFPSKCLERTGYPDGINPTRNWSKHDWNLT